MTPLPVHLDSDNENLSALIESVTESVVKPIIRRKLHVSLRPHDTSRENQDALELVGDIQVSLLAELLDAVSALESKIRDLNGYASTVTENACYQYFRSKYPVRTQQKNKLRYFLTHNGGFAVWRDGSSGKWICGYSDWERSERPVSKVAIDSPVPHAANNGMNERSVLLSIIASLFDELGRPVSLENLTDYVMAKRGLRERVEISEEVNYECASFRHEAPEQTRIEAAMVEVAALKELWAAVLLLPLKHRKALLLNLKDSDGEGLIAALPLSGTASIAEIAEALHFSLEEFAKVWNTLPWSDLSIADHLRLTRQQVINLRQTARARLARVRRDSKQY